MTTDFLGQPITKGAYVAFAVRFSSSMWLQVAKVLDVEEKKITVRSCRRWWDGKVMVLSKNGTLTALERLVVVPIVPEEIQKALEGF